MRPPHALRLVVWITLSAAALGAVFAHVEYQPQDGQVAGTYLHGALIGGLTGGILSSLEIFALNRDRIATLLRLPFLPYLALRSLLYLGVILLVQAAVNWLVPTASGEIASVTRTDLVFSVSVSVGYNLLFGVNDLLGSGVLFAFVAGRYYHPRVEERALLFIDMRASTAIAERLGELRFLDLLNRFISDVSLAIAEAGGEIHKYVGDEVIATWRLAAGPNEARCVQACFAALDRLAARGPAYVLEFGVSPDFRAALHCGPVVVGEIGYLKKEIALVGDTMNTAARIEQACRDVNRRVLASAALLARVESLPSGVVRRALGPLAMRGKEQAVELYALEDERERLPDATGADRDRAPQRTTRSS